MNHINTNTNTNPRPRTLGPGSASPSAVSTALLVSSCTKLFPILLVIWPSSPEDTEENTSTSSKTLSKNASFASRATSYIGWAVLLNNVEALLILLDCGYVIATMLAVTGIVVRSLVEGFVLGLVGLDADGGPVGDVMAGLAWVRHAVFG